MRGSWVRVPAGSQKLSGFNLESNQGGKFLHCPGAEIGRQAWLRAMCPLGRAGSTPALGTKIKFEQKTNQANEDIE